MSQVSGLPRSVAPAGSDSPAQEPVLASALPKARQWFPALSFGVLADICVVALLGLSMWLIVRAGEQPPILHLTFAIVGVRAFAIGRAAFRYADRLAAHDVVFRQLSVLRTNTFERLVPLTPGTLEAHSRGDVLTRLVDDVDELQDYPLRVVQPLLTSGIVIGLSVIVVALLSPLSGLILLLSLMVGGGIAFWLSGAVAARSERRLSGLRSQVVETVAEFLASFEVLSVFGALEAKRAEITRADRAYREAQRVSAKGAGLAAGVVSLFAGAATLGVLALMVAAPLDSAPVMAALIVVPAAVFEVFGAAPVALAALRRVRASGARVDEIVTPVRPNEIPDEHIGNPELSPVTGAPMLELRGVSVRRAGATVDTIESINLVLHAGETALISGESGVGKSTLALALVRFLEYRGSYRLFGVEANTLLARTVRATVGLCEQSPHLFDADIRQNLLFARDDASDAELLTVMERVGLTEWVEERGGLDARVGEAGALVSGGQAQRIALARALLANFPVIIFDEPTANVDPERAHLLLEDLLGAVGEDRSVIVISHTTVPPHLAGQRLRLTAAGFSPA